MQKAVTRKQRFGNKTPRFYFQVMAHSGRYRLAAKQSRYLPIFYKNFDAVADSVVSAGKIKFSKEFFVAVRSTRELSILRQPQWAKMGPGGFQSSQTGG